MENTQTSTINPHAILCKYCGGDFTQQRISNHERDCATKTEAERKKATDARNTYRKNYSAAANGAGATAQRYVERIKAESNSTSARRQHMAHDEAHQRKLEKQRAYYKKYGRAGKKATLRERYKHSVANNPVGAISANKLAKAVSKAQFLLTGQRLQVTLSLDWEMVRTLLVQIAPDIAIDKVELVK